MPKFGETLKFARVRQSLSQDRLSVLSGISQGQISKYEAGESVPDVNGLIALARALRFSVEKLIGGHDARYDLLCQSGDVELPSYVTGGIDAPTLADLQRRLREADATLEQIRATAAQLLKLTAARELRGEGRAPRPTQTTGRKHSRTVSR